MMRVNFLKYKIKFDVSSDTKIQLQHIVFFVLLHYAYSLIAPKYSYMFTKFTLTFQPIKFFISSLMFIIAISMIKLIKDDSLFFIYNIILILLFDGEAICYVYNKDSYATGMFGVFLLLVLLVAFRNMYFKMEKQFFVKNAYIVIVCIAVIMFLPFVFFYYNKIDVRNVLLQSVYETRAAFRNYSNQFTGYLMAPLSRVILPFLIAISIRSKRYMHGIVFGLMIIYVFLCGALKSVYFGLFAIILFYLFNYRKKISFFLNLLIATMFFGIVIWLLLDNVFVLNFVRRIFFVPARLENFYVDYFKDGFTYYSHTPLGLGIVHNKYSDIDIPLYFGSNIMGYSGLNANVGVLIEGFISFGYLGVLLAAVVSALIFHYLKSINIEPIFAGIIFVYIYYFNTAFLSTLLLTHGLLFLIIFAYLFMRQRIE